MYRAVWSRSSLAVAVAIELASTTAFASEAGSASVVPVAAAAPSYALSWVRSEGAEDCQSGRALAREVERRLGRPVFDVSAERSFEIEVTRLGGVYRSDVYVRDQAGHALAHRQLESDEPGCSALMSATALAIALLIDPENASREPERTQGVAAFDPPPAPARPAPAPPLPAPPPLAPPSRPPAAPEPVATPSPPRVPVSFSLRGALAAGVVPQPSPGFELSVQARPAKHWGFALAGSLLLDQPAERGLGKLDVGLTRLAALLTYEVGGGNGPRLLLGAGPSLGVFHVAAREPTPITDPGDYWFSAGELEIDLQVPVGAGIFLEIGGAGLLAVRRQQFLVRGQSEPVWSQSVTSVIGFSGIGVTFP